MMSIIICILKDWIFALSIWALLDFSIQFNELLNSVTDKNESKNPDTEVNTCTINDFLFTVLT